MKAGSSCDKVGGWGWRTGSSGEHIGSSWEEEEEGGWLEGRGEQISLSPSSLWL